MLKLKLSCLVFCAIVFSCNETNYSKLKGIYSDERQTILKLKEDGKYELEITQISTKVKGDYKTKGNKLILEVGKTEYKPYTIENSAQTKKDGYEFMIRGKGWGGLSGAHCKIVKEGQIVQEGYSGQGGIVDFDFIDTGKLIVGKMGWERAEIDLSDLTVRSIIITLGREKFRENMTKYEFEIRNEILKGVDEIKDWELKKKTK